MADININIYTEQTIPAERLREVYTLGEQYEKDIGGTDMGFRGVLGIADYTVTIQDGEGPVVGFLTLSSVSCEPVFDGDSVAFISAGYLIPDYRNSQGQHKDVLKNALEQMVDSLETEQTLERLRIFPGHPYFVNALITDIGREHVLTPLHNLLMERKSEKGQYVGGDIHFQYLFDGDSFRSKLDQEVARQDNEKVEKRTRRDAEEQATKEREMTLGQRIKKWIGW